MLGDREILVSPCGKGCQHFDHSLAALMRHRVLIEVRHPLEALDYPVKETVVT